MFKVLDKRLPGHSIITETRQCSSCNGIAYFGTGCGVFVCTCCDEHEGLARCFCGWSAGGGNGYQELLEMGERIEEDW